MLGALLLFEGRPVSYPQPILGQWVRQTHAYSFPEARMADRRVTQTGKDTDGDITSLCRPGEYWSPRRKADAIADIENRTHRYFVNEAGYESEVHVVERGGRKHLRTYADATSKNNLDNLPNCY